MSHVLLHVCACSVMTSVLFVFVFTHALSCILCFYNCTFLFLSIHSSVWYPLFAGHCLYFLITYSSSYYEAFWCYYWLFYSDANQMLNSTLMHVTVTVYLYARKQALSLAVRQKIRSFPSSQLSSHNKSWRFFFPKSWKLENDPRIVPQVFPFLVQTVFLVCLSILLT